MCSVIDELRVPHWLAQERHLAESEAYFYALNDFSDAQLFPGGSAPRLRFPVQPSEGLAIPEADRVYRDPHGTRFAHHDVVPREALLEHDPACPYRDGAERDMIEISENLRQVARLTGRTFSNNERFTVNDEIEAHIVNIVHTSYVALTPTAIPARPQKLVKSVKTILHHTWMWRRFLHLGPQQNHVHTSLKISFLPPFNASHLIFQTGRVLETGAANLDVARIMLEHVTMRYFHAAGLPRLSVYKRETQNVVATSRMPHRQGLCLPLLQWHMEDNVTYSPEDFPGAVIIHPRLPKVVMLAFARGALVVVGPSSPASMQEAFADLYTILASNVDTPANRALEASVCAPALLAGAPKRKTRQQQQQHAQKHRQLHRVLGAPT